MSLRSQVLDWLSKNVPPARVQHILGVEQMALRLADHYQVDPCQAQTAALMHDLAKYFPSQRLLEWARAEPIPLDPILEQYPHLIHADVSALVARTEFGIEEAEILQAIAHHTLGSPGMTSLSCIVFLADTLESGRGQTPELNRLRQVSFENLHRAVWQTCDYTLQYLIQTGRTIHPRVISTRNWALAMARDDSHG
ncbi:MAG: HD domain-containing protein [Oscillatoriales cyanobacterium RM2_1_1]|nr:HD domain-containing protein [Oscillatoriales cyanobacterium SM2_3_0]NJO45408.1 HD domain-containing protein [Oscillatoriales cyanobacterium RM2_1_1]